MAGPLTEYRLSPTFWSDHFDRCGDHPGIREEVRCTARQAVVRLDARALADLISDAEHYSSRFGPDSEYSQRVLRPAAARTLAALERAGAYPASTRKPGRP